MVARTDAEAPAAREEIPHDHLFMVTGLSSTNLEKLAQEPEPSDFEEAIEATGYGRFNVVLMVCALPAFWSAVSVTSSVSYIFTRAVCDMHLTLMHMGTVNAITYGGMISSAMVWGYLSDTLGRRQIMVWGFIGSGLLEIAAALSQNFAMLLVTRFASGFFFNGPFAVLISYIAELHRSELRARVILLTSLFYTIANVTLPLLAWAILTQDWNLYITESFVIHSWNFFLLATALMPLLSGLVFIFLPESPKFLMSRGRNDEALAVFRKIYALNSGKSQDDYPVLRLGVEKCVQPERGSAALRAGWGQLAPMFRAPHAAWLLLMCAIHIGCMFGSNTLRLWYPQLAAMIGTDSNGTLCSAIAAEPSAPAAPGVCAPLETDMLTYLQSAVAGAGSVLTYAIGGAIVNKCGKKLVASFCAFASSAIIVVMPLLGSSSAAVVAMVTAALAFTSLLSASLSSIAVELFPTSFRVLAMVTFMMMGRVGTIAGTVTFPALITFGCLPPFITISTVLAVCGFACFLVPNTTLKKLE